MHLRIVATDVPDLADLSVGMQKRQDVVEEHPAVGTDIEWSIDGQVVDGEPKGPWIHGKKGDRFLYLVYVRTADGGATTREARAKLLFRDAPNDLIEDGVDVIVTVSIAHEKYDYASGSIRPPQIRWE